MRVLLAAALLSFSIPAMAETALQPITLRELYERALESDENVAIREEALKETGGDALIAAGTVIGDLNFVATHSRQDADVGGGGGSDTSGVSSTLNSETRDEAKFTYNQPIFQGFKEFAGLAGAGSLRNQRIRLIERARQVLFLDLATSFYEVMRWKKDVETIEGIHRLFQERIADLREREQIGRSRASEVVTAKSRMKTLEAELEESRGEYAVSMHLLEFLTGLPIIRYDLADIPVAQAPEELDIREAADLRPDVAAQRHAMEIAWQEVIVAQSDFWPHLSLEGNFYDKREGFQGDIDWDMLLKVDVPIFKGGETLGAVKKASSLYEQAKLTYFLALRTATLQIRQEYERWTSSLSRYRAFEEAVAAAEENFALQKDEYGRSLVSNLDVLQALEELLNTRRDANTAHYEMKQNYWRYQVAKGNCCEEPS